MTPLRAIDRFWYAALPAERLALLRISVGAYGLVYLALFYPALTAVQRFHPSEFAAVGPVSVLTTPLGPASVHAAVIFGVLSGLAFVLGYRYRLFGPIFGFAFLWVTSYRSSWGMKFHTENLAALHLLLLALAPAADTLSLDSRSRRLPTPEPHGRYGWPIRAISLVTVTTYLLAGVAKLRLAGWAWTDGEILRAQIAYDNLRKIELGSWYSPLGVLLVGKAWPFTLLSWATLAIELGAPLALFGRRAARFWSFTAFAFHVGVLLLMAIAFPYPLSFIAYLSFFPIESVQNSRPYRWLSQRVEVLLPKPDR